MKIFNSFTNQLEDFVPVHPGKVNMYICGPTVYNYIHIGNARPVIFFDTVRRYFEHRDFEVTFASNFTDVDDKIITKAIELETTEQELAEKFITAFLNDVEKVGSMTDYIKPRVTDYMDKIIVYIQTLIDKGYAYKSEGDVYFRVGKIDDYGQLSNRNIDDLISGARIEVNDKKENPLDFTLWKKTDVGITFDAPFGRGRPGWHTECVAMIDNIFGEEIDIHGGGSGLLFPHHENEIAQAEALHGHHVAKYWMHNGLLNFGGGKMSKSDGNVILVKDLTIDPNVFRLFTLSTHYRSPINFTDDVLDNYQTEWDKIYRVYKQLYLKLDLADQLYGNAKIDPDLLLIYKDFLAAMDQDFNTPNAITALQDLVKKTNQLLRTKTDFEVLLSAKKLFDDFFDVFGLKTGLQPLSKDDKDLYHKWNEARTNKDFDTADELRNLLQEKGIL
ncbi:cysteine--tRNA ligase [Candidatus Xianfuyuplasma coldseepsis]|uniref:Cysteine--tRNA ligase n=1 Tax=Candidatus Xianfuyuplasma coldseepsis TaxID=2782163 RepID=A0A7L7KSW9_9MOLU|nr:cysteine--tRNA ligase [Xianfuyuplasma coldseepsis]QMS85326.1 cysteine--tRNA ligase [Xianfuyuplasma coldseepsis]